MKHIRISLIVALIIGAMAAVSSVRAQGTDNKAKTEAPAGKQRLTPEQRLDQMAERLSLDAGQKAKLKTAMEDQTKAMSELRKDSALSQEDRRAKSKVISDKYNETVKAFLTTPEQKTKFETWTQQQGKKGRKKAQ